MAFTRTNLAAAVAGTLSLAMIAGCGPTPNAGAPATGSTAPSAAPTASAAPTTAPTTTPSAAVSTDPTATGSTSPAPSASAPAPTGEKVVVSGTVYSEEGAKLDGVLVSVVSLDANQPYNATTTSSQGSYVFNNVPEGVKVEVKVTRDGYTTRTQVESFQKANTNKNVLDFGGTDAGKAFFISKYPEIVSSTPAEDDTNVDPSTISVKVTLSEALNEDNKRRFEDALRLVPADKEAIAETGATAARASFVDLEDTDGMANGNNAATAIQTGDFKYNIGKSVLFLEDSSTRANITWSSDNKEATLTFNAPLLASSNDPAKYNITLFNSSSDVIKDNDNNQLGTNHAASSLATKYSTLNQLIYNAFKKKDLALNSSTANAYTRWDDTHDNGATFEVKEDDDAPILQATTVSTVGNDTRFELSFNEPVAAYDGTSVGYSFLKFLPTFSNGKTALSYFTFAVGKTGKLATVDLKGGSDVKAELITIAAADRAGSGTENANAAGNTANGFQSTLTNRRLEDGALGSTANPGQEEEFQLSDACLITNGRAGFNAAVSGGVVIEVDSKDAKKLLITVKGKTLRQVFDTEMAEIKARVEGMRDPAGNSINKATADRNVVTGRI